MTTALVISQILLMALVVALGFVVLALARQIGLLHERIAPAGALAVNQKLRVGETAPRLDLTAIDGEAVSTGASGRALLLFFLSPDCPVCKSLLPVLRSTARAERDWVSLVLASDGGTLEAHRALRKAEKVEDIPYVLSEELGRAFAVAKLPYAVLIDEKGVIASMGLVNSREHVESLFEAKDRGVASLQEYLERNRNAGEHKRVGA